MKITVKLRNPAVTTTLTSSSRKAWLNDLRNLNKAIQVEANGYGPAYRLGGWVLAGFVGQEPTWMLSWVCLECAILHDDRSNRTPYPASHTAWHEKRRAAIDTGVKGL